MSRRTNTIGVLAALLLLAAIIGLYMGGGMTTREASAKNMEKLSVATLAGGCFWCVEADMEKLPGVARAVSGYAGGEVVNPSYKQVSSGTTGHREAVNVYFDPAKISYAQILDAFWKHHDPADAGGSFGDRGFQYTSAIFYHDEDQRRIAEASKKTLEESGRLSGPVATAIVPFTNFYPAEGYHQDYYKKNPIRYKSYRFFSGRDRYMEDTWGDEAGKLIPGPTGKGGDSAYTRPDDATLRKRLTDMQYRVTRKDATEPPFDNEYWDNKAPGIYVDVVSGEPLFSSTDKFKSGTGWPSFTRPLEPGNVVEREDRSLFTVRIEVRSKHGDSHLGHVFDDGPAPTGLRYCINSAALRFIPASDLEREGYGKYRRLFE